MSATCGLHFLIGKKGAGKSMMAAHMMWKTIRDTKRVIVTNLPVKWDGLAEFMEPFGISMPELTERITIIEDMDDLSRFWLIRGNGWGIPEISKDQWKLGIRTDYRRCFRWKPTVDTATRCKIQDLKTKEIDDLLGSGELEQIAFSSLPSVYYGIDEIQNIFPARDWQSTAPSLLWHLSQQRKLSDEILAISQRPTLMDKQFRELADDWLFLENFGKKRKGFFRLPTACGWAQYDELPGPGSEPMVRGLARLRVHDVGKTYDTSAGTGIAGGLLADTNETGAGLNWKIGAAALLGLLIALWFIPSAVIKIATHWTRKATDAALVNKTPTVTNTPPPKIIEAVATGLSPGASVKNYSAPPPPKAEPPRKRLTGITCLYGTWTAFFSDGETRVGPSPNLVSLFKDGMGRPYGVRTEDGTYFLGR